MTTSTTTHTVSIYRDAPDDPAHPSGERELLVEVELHGEYRSATFWAPAETREADVIGAIDAAGPNAGKPVTLTGAEKDRACELAFEADAGAAADRRQGRFDALRAERAERAADEAWLARPFGVAP